MSTKCIYAHAQGTDANSKIVSITAVALLYINMRSVLQLTFSKVHQGYTAVR